MKEQTPPETTIRPYEARDRTAVRRICCDTADRGGPIESIFHDRELVADLVTRYYTDYEPETSWVAESDGQVVGYLTGALDTTRQQRVMVRKILPAAIASAIRRGVFRRKETWRLAALMLRNAFSFFSPRRLDLRRWPAHLHIDIQDGYRGARVGQRLMTEFENAVRRHGLPGIHASVRGDNSKACAFFEKMGYIKLHERIIRLPINNEVRDVPAVIYGKQTA